MNDSLVTFRTSQGAEVRASLLSLTSHAAALEIYGPDTVIRTSEALEDFQVLVNDRSVYSGRAVVRDTVNTGTMQVCSVLLDGICFDAGSLGSLGQQGQMRQCFADFMAHWQGVCKVKPEFKAAVGEIETFLIDLRCWLEQVELGLRSSPNPDRERQERAVIGEVSPHIIQVIDTLFERYEEIHTGLEQDTRPVHRTYVQRHLHPIVLCAPFAYRTYRKPLGYAGDYEMVNMMLRDPQEGSSLFAKIFNVWLLHQGSAAAHRNRINYLKRRLVEVTAEALRAGRRCRILNLGCGPAREVQEFLAESELSNSADFTLLDFNDETLRYAAEALEQQQRQFRRRASIKAAKKSVQQLLKEMVRAGGGSREGNYDLIYCAGLFDYLPDRTCRRLMTLFYRSLAPHGWVLATNVTPASPNRGSLELILDWHLIYRDAAQLAALRPEGVPETEIRIVSDGTGINMFLEAQKPNGG
jgi:extracellular factor (EF) 3-hydroxypalmitic acid methyl ester biosynthesis protein